MPQTHHRIPLTLLLSFFLGLPLGCASVTSTGMTVLQDFPHDRPIAGEEFTSSQFAILAQQLGTVLPERPGVVDLYFVGFGGDAKQDVFMNEVLYAKTLFEHRFDTQGRSLALINNRKTTHDVPLASFTNLRATLAHLGQVLNPEEDILFLLLTSHGLPNGTLAVRYEPLPLRQISSTDLAQALEESGIKWRVIVVSACFSGAFIDALKNEHTMIMTASAADRPSFGCADGADLTYFGEAFFQDQLNQETDFLTAFEGTDVLIRMREEAEKLEPSQPQISSSPTIVEKLREFSARLHPGTTGRQAAFGQ